jgi:hypothetical protein
MRNKLKRLPLIVTMALLLLGGCGEDGVFSGSLVLGGDLQIEPGLVETADVLLADGTVTIAEGATLRGDLYQMLGTLTINGTVDGNVLLYSGTLVVGPQARITGDLQLSSGEIWGDPEQAVAGTIVRGPQSGVFGPEWLQRSFARQLLWIAAQTSGLSLLAALMSLVFPRSLERVRLAIREYPAVCGAMGLLVLIVGLALVVQMLFTVLLIPLSLLGVVLLLVAAGLGWMGFGVLSGRWLAHCFAWNWPDALVAGIGTLVFVFAINLLALIPGIGPLLAIGSAVVGIGAVFQTRFGLRRFQAVER